LRARGQRVARVWFCDSDTSPEFCGGFVLQKPDAKPPPFATRASSSESRAKMTIAPNEAPPASLKLSDPPALMLRTRSRPDYADSQTPDRNLET